MKFLNIQYNIIQLFLPFVLQVVQVQKLYVDLHTEVVNGVVVYKILKMLKNKNISILYLK